MGGFVLQRKPFFVHVFRLTLQKKEIRDFLPDFQTLLRASVSTLLVGGSHCPDFSLYCPSKQLRRHSGLNGEHGWVILGDTSRPHCLS